jgi:hypothetical protein
MARVVAHEVKDIIDTDLSDRIVQVFIDAANLTVTELLGSNTDLSDDAKKEVERWLTAHLLASTRERQAESEKIDVASIVYQGKTGKGLESTLYGQQAKLLDTTGILAQNLGKASIFTHAVTSFE